MNWVNTNVNLGNVKENSFHVFNFLSTKDLEIKNIIVSCSSCTKLKGYKNKKLTVKYTAGKIPYHLTDKKQYVSKTITITYKDETTDVLTFNAVIRK